MDIASRLNQEQLIQQILPNPDQNLLKALTHLQITHPTFAQEQLFLLSQQHKHLILHSGIFSGKTTGLLILQINNFIAHINQIRLNQSPDFKPSFSVFMTASKDITQKNFDLCQNMTLYVQKSYNIRILNLSNFQEDQLSLLPNTHYILISTISTFLRFAKHTKFDAQQYVNFTCDDIDFMLSFGYKQDLDNFHFFFKQYLPECQFYWALSEEISEEFSNFKKSFLTKSAIIDVQDEFDEMDEGEKKNEQTLHSDHDKVVQYYATGDEVSQFMLLYSIYKLRFSSGKTLILCRDLNQVYQVNMFLDRIGEKDFSPYNHENPLNLRYYLVSIFNTGLLKTLVCTKQVFVDLDKKDFEDKKRKTTKLKGISNIVIMDLNCLSDIYINLYKKFQGNPGNIFISVVAEESNLENLMQIIEQQKQNFNNPNIKEFPLKKHEIEAFRYRVNNVVEGITKKQLNNYKMLDFKKKMLKSPDLKEYYEKNPTEKELLIENIQKLKMQLKKNEIRCEGECPDYLLPSFMKDKKQQMEEKVKKILVYKPTNLNKYQENKYVYIKENQENEGETDASRLKIISRKKQWKLRHGFKLKKINKRLEKKGVFTPQS